jgi:hypothetical protein
MAETMTERMALLQPDPMKKQIQNLAIQITERLARNAVESVFARHTLDDLIAMGEFMEGMTADDAVDVALGRDIGCLGPEDCTPEKIDVLYVEQALTVIVDHVMTENKRMSELIIKDLLTRAPAPFTTATGSLHGKIN